MTGLFRKLLVGAAPDPDAVEARAAELRGDYAQAAVLFADAGLDEDSARMLVRRGDTESAASARLRHYARAAATAPPDSPIHLEARTKRALVAVAVAAQSPVTSGACHDLLEAARELEALGEHGRAAEAYAHARDIEGQIRALERAGEVEKLEALLTDRETREREARAMRHGYDEFALLVASGQRREAAALGRSANDPALRERGRDIEARRAPPDALRIAVRGRPMVLLLGRRLVIGRAANLPGEDLAEARLVLPSAALSRRHLVVDRGTGGPFVRDLGSRHGTYLRGLALSGEAEVSVGRGLELQLGRRLAIVVRPSEALAGAVAIDIGAASYVAPLGPAWLGIGRWRIDRAEDGWSELSTDDDPPAFGAHLRLAPRITLIAGDVLSTGRDADPEVAVEAPARAPP